MFKKKYWLPIAERSPSGHPACKELGIKTVAIHSEADAATCTYGRRTNMSALPEAALSYRNIPECPQAPPRSPPDAIHPGMGFPV